VTDRETRWTLLLSTGHLNHAAGRDRTLLVNRYLTAGRFSFVSQQAWVVSRRNIASLVGLGPRRYWVSGRCIWCGALRVSAIITTCAFRRFQQRSTWTSSVCHKVTGNIVDADDMRWTAMMLYIPQHDGNEDGSGCIISLCKRESSTVHVLRWFWFIANNAKPFVRQQHCTFAICQSVSPSVRPVSANNIVQWENLVKTVSMRNWLRASFNVSLSLSRHEKKSHGKVPYRACLPRILIQRSISGRLSKLVLNNSLSIYFTFFATMIYVKWNTISFSHASSWDSVRYYYLFRCTILRKTPRETPNLT